MPARANTVVRAHDGTAAVMLAQQPPITGYAESPQMNMPNPKHLQSDTNDTRPRNPPTSWSLRNWYKWPVLYYFLHKYKERSKRIDVVSRVLFPAGFCIFNVFYWIVYLLRPLDYADSDAPKP